MINNKGVSMKNIVVMFSMFLSVTSMAALPRFNVDPYSHYYTAEQTFAGGLVASGGITLSGALTYTGLSDVNGDALCLSSTNVLGTCGAAVFTTSVSSPILLSPATGSADDILIKPAGTTALTIAEGGNATLVGDLVVSGGDITALNVQSGATGGADDIAISPAAVAALTVAEAGDVQINKPVTSHAACAAAGDRGRIELYDNGSDVVSICACVQTGVATYAWAALSAGGSC